MTPDVPSTRDASSTFITDEPIAPAAWSPAPATTGIIGASVVMMTLLALPVMLERNYDKSLATGTIACLLYTSPSPRDRG